MMGDQAWGSLEQVVASLCSLLAGYSKYVPNFSVEARQLLEKTVAQAEKLKADVQARSNAKVAGYLLLGAKSKDISSGQSSLLQSLGSILNGSMPLPRGSKEELTSLKQQLGAWTRSEDNVQQAQVADSLHALFEAAVSKQKDVDTIEVTVDDIMQKLVLQLHGVNQLPQTELQPELDALEDGVNSAGGQGVVGAVFSLALNALQRLHAAQLPEAESEESEEEQEAVDEEDEDDPFFMPLPSAALKMADERKFRMLAQPIGLSPDAETTPPMLQMDESTSVAGGAVHMGADGAGAGADEVAAPTLTEADFEPVPEAEVLRSSRATSQIGRGSITGSIAGALSPEASGPLGADSPGARALASGATSTVVSPAVTRAQHETVAEGEEGEEGEAGTKGTPAGKEAQAGADGAVVPSPTGVAGDEQHKQFVSFLQGQNPQACMFHAQMRLSLEGCRKLANFLTNSSRVRALSLSHNFLGDDGMQIICEGLLQNTSVTTIDLPDNNISDHAACLLADSIRHNTSLTQLQLASNNIGDAGATALANLIKANKSLKKLGLANNNIGKAGCKALTEAISANKTLMQLQLLPGNPVEEKDAKALAKALQHSKKFSIRNLLGL